MSNLPSGEIPRGAIRFNTDSNKPELWDGSQWAEFQLSTPNLGRGVDTEPGARGVVVGGYTPSFSDAIDYINISSTGDSVDFGDTAARASYLRAGNSSNTRGVYGGGYGGPTSSTVLEYLTFSSTGSVATFGDFDMGAKYGQGAVSNQTRGIQAGYYSAGSNIDYYTLASLGSVQSFGNLSDGRAYPAGINSPTRGIFCGGFYGDVRQQSINTVDFVTIATTGDAQDFGDLTEHKMLQDVGVCNSTRGIIAGGLQYPANTRVGGMEFIQMSSTGNFQNFGELIDITYAGVAMSSSTRGVFAGTVASPVNLNNIEYITISTQGNSIDFGDLQNNRAGGAGMSNAHGGL